MVKLVCTEFDEFEEALSGVQGRYLLRTKPTTDWRLRIVDLGGVELMLGCEGAGNLYRGASKPGSFMFFFPLDPHHSSTVDGRSVDGRVCWMAPDVMFNMDARSPTKWLGIVISATHVLHRARLHEDEFNAEFLGRNTTVAADRKSLARLMWIARRLLHTDEKSPEILHAPAAERAARQELLDATFNIIFPVRAWEKQGRRTHDRTKVLQIALGLMEDLDGPDIDTDNLCAATGASERTLRNIFNDYLGMSPHQYLINHRIHVIRSAIRTAGPDETVTTICAKHGVWDFGRFAKQYKASFGILPSEALYGVRHWTRSQFRQRAVTADH